MKTDISLLVFAAYRINAVFASNHQRGWEPASPGDQRSPCPALNTLANHHFLPHNGKNITVTMAVEAFKAGLNFGSDVITTAATFAVNQCSNITGTECTAFDFENLHLPHAGEHDASLSRFDSNFGTMNNFDFKNEIWSQVLDVWKNADTIDFHLANNARKMRIETANATDLPGWFEENDSLSFLEHAFYLSAMGDTVKSNAPKNLVRYFFENERLPYALGWNATQRDEITQDTLNTMMAKIKVA